MTTRDSASLAGEYRRRICLILCLLVILAYGGLLRFRAANESLWLDELHTAWTVSGSLGDVADRSFMGNQSPAYPWIVWCVTRCAGLDEISVRLISFASGTLLIIAGFVVGQRWSGSGSIALLVSLLIAVDPHSVYFAQEGRVYALVQLLGLVHLVCFERLVHDSALKWRVGWIGLTCVLVYLHYSSAIVLIGELTFLIAASTVNASYRRQLPWRIVDLSIMALAMLPIYWHLAEIAQRRANWARFVDQASWNEALRIFRFDAFLLVPVTVLLILGSLTLSLGTKWSVERSLIRRLLLMFCWLAAPLVVTWVSTEFDAFRLFFRRYLMVVGVGPVLIAALLGGLLPRGTPRRFYCIATAIGCLVLLTPARPSQVDGVSYWHSIEDWRAAVQFVNARPKLRHLPVFIQSGLIEDHALGDENVSDDLIEFCLFPIQSLYPLDGRTADVAPLPSHRTWELTPDKLEQLENAGGAWIFLRGDKSTASRFAPAVVRWLKQHGVAATIVIHRFGNVTVLELRVES